VRWESATQVSSVNGRNEYHDSEEAVTNADGRFVIGARQTWRLNPLNEIYRPDCFFQSLVMGDGNFVTSTDGGKEGYLRFGDRIRAESGRLKGSAGAATIKNKRGKE
jgi:hypothetical protein